MDRRRISRRRKKSKGRHALLWIGAAVLGAVVIATGVYGVRFLMRERGWKMPEELLQEYMSYIPQQEYGKMYGMLDAETAAGIDMDSFTERNSAIYEGIGIQSMAVEVLDYNKEEMAVTYQTSFGTVAGQISFDNKAYFRKGEEGYGLVWEDSLIFPGLGPEDKVRVASTGPERGEILDREGRLLAGKITASSVGIVPGKLEDREQAIREMAELLEISEESIEKKLSAKWVRDDYFVPIKTLPKVGELERMYETEEETLQKVERQESLLAIPGVMITDTEVRGYPYGKAAAHLVGYVQNVTAEDLEKHAGEGYTADSMIGRTGAESLFEEELRGEAGYRIYITDADGNEKGTLANKPVQDGQDVRLTIDARLQQALYGQFWEDKSCSAAIDPGTGEVLALVSTPSYDDNDFIMGMSEDKWTALNEDEKQPLYNRFRQVWCPGSSFKPVTAAVGLETGTVDPAEDYGNEGSSWQKDSSWGSYYISTLHTYEPVILENALIYSDNIYFAKAALKIGAEAMENALAGLGFGEEVPFDIRMAKSQYSNAEHIGTEIQLADSGYGQGQILVNPLHLACIYSAFYKEGNMVKPYLQYREGTEAGQAEYWIEGAFGSDTAKTVLEGLCKVVNDPQGTGYAAHREDVLLAGKTGTAEIKDSKEDTSGTELGWFVVFTAEDTAERPLLLVSMAEDVKDRGGSGYVVGKVKTVLSIWFAKGE